MKWIDSVKNLFGLLLVLGGVGFLANCTDGQSGKQTAVMVISVPSNRELILCMQPLVSPSIQNQFCTYVL